MINRKKNNLSLGKLGEEIAARYLQRKGYKIIEMNFRKRWGEIDIIGLDNETLAFIEVKTRMEYDTVTPEQSITPWKIRSLKKSALFYKNMHQELPEALRIDFVGIVLNETYKPTRINLIKNITV